MKVITYELLLKEPVLVTAPGGDPNADNSHGYVPGSALRGALVSRYLQQGGAAQDTAFPRRFLQGDVAFLNAYPTDTGGNRTLPTPAGWILQKDDETKKIYNRLAGAEPALPAGVKAAFVQVQDGVAIVPEVSFQVSIHTARNREKGRAVEGDPGSAVFQYRALAAGQRFTAAIAVNSGEHEKEDAEQLKALLDGGDLLLGGSQSAGYGLTAVRPAKIVDEWREVGGHVTAIAAGDDFTIYLASDALLRDPQTGRESNDILNALPPALQARIEQGRPPHTFSSMTWVGGFNAKWGLPLPQEWAVRKGSMWRLRATADISAEEIWSLEASGVGERLAEGFGRLAFNLPWIGDAQRLADDKETGAPVAFDIVEPDVIGQAANAQLAQMNKRLVEAELERRLVIAAQKKAKQRRGRLSNSQLARLRLRVRRQQDNFDDFYRYLEDTRKRKSANDQFSKFRVAGENFREWLEKIAKNPGDVWQDILPEAEEWQPHTVGDYSFDRNDAAMTQQSAVRFIDAVCEQLAKKGNSNGRA